MAKYLVRYTIDSSIDHFSKILLWVCGPTLKRMGKYSNCEDKGREKEDSRDSKKAAGRESDAKEKRKKEISLTKNGERRREKGRWKGEVCENGKLERRER